MHAVHSMGPLLALGLLEIMKSGATTLVNQFRPRQRAIFDLARQWAAPTYFLPRQRSKVAAAAQGSLAGDPGLAAFERLFADYDEGPSGRIRVMLGPHAANSCAPDLLTALDRIARERDLLVTIHLAQSQGKVARVAKDRGATFADYVASVGFLREGVIFAHGTYLTAPELAKVAGSGAAIVNCASVFLRGGKSPNVAHLSLTAFAWVSAPMLNAWTSSLRCEPPDSPPSRRPARAMPAHTAAELVHAATVASADILRRSDFGWISPGAAADLVVSMPCGRTCRRSAIRSERWCGMPPQLMSIRLSSTAAWSFALARSWASMRRA